MPEKVFKSPLEQSQQYTRDDILWELLKKARELVKAGHAGDFIDNYALKFNEDYDALMEESKTDPDNVAQKLVDGEVLRIDSFDDLQEKYGNLGIDLFK